MTNISDLIEKFILDTMKQDNSINLSRNQLANFFGVSPSQINYVLSTRFTVGRGYDVVSKRGGGGCIIITKLNLDRDDLISNTLMMLKEPIDYISAKQLIINLLETEIINEGEADIIVSAITPKALNNPINSEDYLRSQILTSVLINLLKKKEEEHV